MKRASLVKKPFVYLDHAATTPLDSVVREQMVSSLETFGNPSALYTPAQQAKQYIDEARARIAQIFGAQADTIIFTSGGTESDNMALFGVAHSLKKGHIITSAIEHHAVLHPCQQLEKEGFEVTYLSVNEQGIIDPQELKQALRADTILVSLMYANNEVGSIQPIADIGRIMLQWRKQQNTIYPFFHTDACQAAGYLPLSVEKLHVDLMTINASKIYGPKGIGALYVRRGVPLMPLFYGGGQEMGKRSGTENVASIVGLASALALVEEEKEHTQVRELRDYLWKRMQENISDIYLNGPDITNERLANNLHVSFSGVDAEALVLYLDAKGIFVGTGAACATGEEEGSHVLLAMGTSAAAIRNSVRFTLGKDTCKKDIDYVMQQLPPIVQKLREMSTFQ